MKWEYMMMLYRGSQEDITKLNDYGASGWEVIFMTTKLGADYLMMKRRIG
jgi:hypothetical protein